jgi:spore maturation protein CgeB
MIRKILYIAFKYDHGKKDNGLAINYKAWFESFERLGYQIEGVFFEDYDRQTLQNEILKKANEKRPDIVFFILQKNQVELSTIISLQQMNFFTVAFFGDDQWRFDDWTSLYATYFNVCITTDKFSIEKYREIGQKNIIYSQWASLCPKIKGNIPYKYDVSFIGGANPYRKWFIAFLEKKGISVHCFGSGWKNGRASYEEMEKIFSSSKINLNISNSVSYDFRFMVSSLKNFASTIKAHIKNNSKNSSQTKARNFEIPVQGGFQITDYVPTLDEYFDIGKEVVCYNTVDDSVKIIKYYLKHEDSRETIKYAGIQKARSRHTFKNRIREFMSEIEQIYDRQE